MKKQKIDDPLVGTALRNLRRAAGKNILEVATPIGRTEQELSRWERAERPWPAGVVDDVLRALDATPDQLNAEIQRLRRLTDGDKDEVGHRADFAYSAAAGLRSLIYAGDEMSPWLEAGEHVYFEPGRQPKKQEGCLVELASGERIVRIYERQADGFIFLKSYNPTRIDNILYSNIKRLSRIAMRGG